MKKLFITIAVMLAVSAAHAASVSTNNVVAPSGWTQEQINQQTFGQVQSITSDVSDNHTNISKIQRENVLRDKVIGQNSAAIGAMSGQVGHNTQAIQTIQQQAASGTFNGKDGKDGINGANGRDGVDGKNGIDGKDGQAGGKGDKGDAGINGRDGIDGKDADMTLVSKNTADIKQQRVEFSQRAADADQRIAQQKADQQKANKAVSDKLDNHEGRISSLEQQSNSKFAALDKRIGDVKKHASAGTASAFAQANIPQVMAGGEFGIGAGAGTYDGQSSVAVGASYAPHDNVVVKATVSTDTMHNFGAGAGVMVSFR